jgi:hypothetical protein
MVASPGSRTVRVSDTRSSSKRNAGELEQSSEITIFALGEERSTAIKRDADRLGITCSDVGRLKATQSDSEQLGVSWNDAEHVKPDSPDAPSVLRYPPIHRWRASLPRQSERNTNPARSLPHTPGVIALSVPAPVMRPVDLRQPARRNLKCPQTMSASHIFYADDSLQEPTLKRQRVLQAQMNNLWPM